MVRKRADKQEQIVRRAASLFRKRGYYGVTVDDIAQSLNVSKISIYYYIENKEEILYRIHDMAHTALLEGLRAIVASGDPAETKLRQAIANHISVVCSEMSPTTAALQQEYALSAKNKRRLIKKRDAYDRTLRQIISEGIEQGVFIDCDPKLVSFAIEGAANYMPHWYSSRGPLTKEQIANIFAEYLVRGLLARPAAESLGVKHEPET